MHFVYVCVCIYFAYVHIYVSRLSQVVIQYNNEGSHHLPFSLVVLLSIIVDSERLVALVWLASCDHKCI